MNKFFILQFFLVFMFTNLLAQQVPRTEEYALLELSTSCKKSMLTVTNNAQGTILTATYSQKQNDLTDDERLLIAMNDLNGKGFKLKNSTVVTDKCKSKRAFLFFKSRPHQDRVAEN